MTPDQTEYTGRLRAEIENYRNVEHVHDLPSIYSVWAKKYLQPKIDQICGATIEFIEEFYALYISRYAAENPSQQIRIASIGAGNGDLEVRIAALLKKSGIHRFQFECMDINPQMLERGREAARQADMASHFEFVETDVSAWAPHHSLDVVMAHHSLHHIEPLETLFANIRTAIGDKGYFLSCDMIGRNGHMRWSEALEILRDIWTTMPDRYKYNHQLNRFEEVYENWDCSTESFEGIRAQDILPLLVRLFKFEAFAAFGNLTDVFVDRSFGHNLSPDNPEDVAFINRIGDLNDRLISEGKIKPTQMAAVMRTKQTAACRCYLHWTPEFCVRVPTEEADPSLPVPISGCGAQRGRPTGIWIDRWITSPFQTKIEATMDLVSITIHGFLPEGWDEPELTIRVDGVDVRKERLRAGPLSIQIGYSAPKGTVLVLNIAADKLNSPARHGSPDERNLALLLNRIHFAA